MWNRAHPAAFALYDSVSLVQRAVSSATINCVFMPFKRGCSRTPACYFFVLAPQGALKAKGV